MELNPLTAISPIDGRYRHQVQHLGDYFSEYALMKYRVFVEVEYFIFLSDKKFFALTPAIKKQLRSEAEEFSLQDAQEIKKTELIVNHDVKAVEYFLKSRLDRANVADKKEWVHFGLTSQDIN